MPESQLSSEPSMTLWTWQGCGFQIDRERVDPKRSYYLAQCPNLVPKYEAVRKRLGLKTYHFLWCWTMPPDKFRRGGKPLTKWTLDVPLDQILFIDELLAGWLKDGFDCPPPEVWSVLRKRAKKKFPNNLTHREEFIKTKLGNCKAAAGTSPKASYKDIFLANPEPDELVTAVIRSPINSCWIREQQCAS